MAVGSQTAIYWDFGQRATQLKFLGGLDPTHFSYQAEVHGSQLGGTYDTQASVAIRTTYSHALETAFALLGAAIQAPECPTGWLLHYRVTDIVDVLRAIQDEDHLLNRMGLTQINWDIIAENTFPWNIDVSVRADHLAATSLLWKRLADGFIDKSFQDEYNSIKHGFRVMPGGWFFAMGGQESPGVPAPLEGMHTISNEKYGSSYVESVKLRNRQYRIMNHRLNWNPHTFLTQMPFIVASMQNLISYLLYRNGSDSEKLRVFPLTKTEVEAAVSNGISAVGINPNRVILPDWFDDVSRKEIIDSYFNP